MSARYNAEVHCTCISREAAGRQQLYLLHFKQQNTDFHVPPSTWSQQRAEQDEASSRCTLQGDWRAANKFQNLQDMVSSRWNDVKGKMYGLHPG